MEIRAASDHSVLVTFAGTISLAAHGQVAALAARLAPHGFRNLHPGYASLLVSFDPARMTHAEARERIERALAEPATTSAVGRRVEIPVCYGADLGPDLADVAAHCGLPPEQVIERHASGIYRVYFLGFSPGFPYLGGLDPSLATPRLEGPRARVPAGSVAIGGSQTGVYPLESPGGWRLIGRTPLRLFDPNGTDPTALRMGDEVRFTPISRSEFDRGR